jgi:hypothetical protein
MISRILLTDGQIPLLERTRRAIDDYPWDVGHPRSAGMIATRAEKRLCRSPPAEGTCDAAYRHVEINSFATTQLLRMIEAFLTRPNRRLRAVEDPLRSVDPMHREPRPYA